MLTDDRTDQRPPSRDELVDRLIRLRNALEGLAADNAVLRRDLARVRAENRALRAQLTRPSQGGRTMRDEQLISRLLGS